MFWGSKKLARLAGLYKIIKPFDHRNVAHGAYELTMGDMYYTTDCKVRQPLKNDDQFKIRPGQFALLETREVICVPRNAIGLISIKAKIKFKGLINVSGFHVDPGYDGRLVFSVYNAGGKDIVLSRNKPIFLIWFCDLDQEEDGGYDGNSNKGITDEMVEAIGNKIASPSGLNKRLSRLEMAFTIAVTAIGIGVTVVVGLITIFFTGIGNSLQEILQNIAK
ncbi:MAG: hypothetical protein OCC46_02830 [Pseudodesulfovibrio sp.]